MNFCRNRLNEAAALLGAIDRGDAGGPSPFGPGRDLFPGGRRGLDEAAADLVAGLSAEDLLDLDNRVQMQVRTHFRSVITLLPGIDRVAGPAGRPGPGAGRAIPGRPVRRTNRRRRRCSRISRPTRRRPIGRRPRRYDEAGPTSAEKAGTPSNCWPPRRPGRRRIPPDRGRGHSGDRPGTGRQPGRSRLLPRARGPGDRRTCRNSARRRKRPMSEGRRTRAARARRHRLERAAGK